MTRANPVRWFIVAFFLIGGVFFWIALPGIGIGQIWVGVAVLLGLIYLAVNRRGRRMEELRQTGVPGQATILEMTQTGVYVNENPQVKLKMRIEATGIAPYELEKRVTVPMIALGVLGSARPLTVHVDPNDHEKIAIDWSFATSGGAGAAPMAAPARAEAAASDDGEHDERSGVDRLVELQQMRDKGLITEKEFEENKTRILRSL